MSAHLLVTSDRIGSGDEALGELLMKNLLYAVARAEVRPVSITFMNEGVRLACEGSASIADLQLCVDAGVPVRSCGTCLDFLGLTDALAVGEVGTMVGAVAGMLDGAPVVTLG